MILESGQSKLLGYCSNATCWSKWLIISIWYCGLYNFYLSFYLLSLLLKKSFNKEMNLDNTYIMHTDLNSNASIEKSEIWGLRSLRRHFLFLSIICASLNSLVQIYVVVVIVIRSFENSLTYFIH